VNNQKVTIFNLINTKKELMIIFKLHKL